ncbi:DUF2306 domain-containing protein [Xanthomonas sp. A2111]|uniref:DUF2306 domain-containing protein n=1 Tax=Xanthomonas hawaiiensis TaxID=3003247 RepID=A0ABU2IBL6_9XANT|nr:MULTISPECIES: DUF2306 domain-containing protein [unclassified Xanthomonas]MBO9829200.1 DUF2306 domain-containing protein [Xanthomonas sp. A2111]MBO9874327.1 DUF2306 domain-containing protein [Xanthomonas sp. D-93]MDS9995033.1 DUF2306 domain-containing protein [Xanthomonas sp. A2111]WNH46700.1 DUF2306 domain-containing protein [Xanthomonas sp. A6251]
MAAFVSSGSSMMNSAHRSLAPATVKSRGSKYAWGVLAMLSGAVALVSYRYLFDRGPVPPGVAANRHVHPWLIVHATSAATALLCGPLQFVRRLRLRHPRWHRATGRVYVAGCMVGGVSALFLAAGISTGPVAGAGFGALGIAWMATTAIALRKVLTGRLAEHRRWMIRSFALTLSAVTLRLYLPVSTFILGIEFAVAYRAIAWLCWLPNLLAAEWLMKAHPSAPGQDSPDFKRSD